MKKQLDENDPKIVDQEILVVSRVGVLIQRQIVLTVDKETFNRIQKTRNIDRLEKLEKESQLYLDNASICLISKPYEVSRLDIEGICAELLRKPINYFYDDEYAILVNFVDTMMDRMKNSKRVAKITISK